MFYGVATTRLMKHGRIGVGKINSTFTIKIQLEYGMPARYDAAGNFIYPEGFDSDTQEWKPGYESQREEWERQYAEAQSRFMAHKKQKSEAKAADAAAPAAPAGE